MTCWCCLQITKSLGKQTQKKRWFKNNKKKALPTQQVHGASLGRWESKLLVPIPSLQISQQGSRTLGMWHPGAGWMMVQPGICNGLMLGHVGRSMKFQTSSPTTASRIQRIHASKTLGSSNKWGTAIAYSPFSIACHSPLTKASPCESSASDQGILHRVHVPRSSTLNQSSFHASGETATLALRPIREKSANRKHNTNWYKPLLEIEVFARRCWLRLVMVCEYFWRLYGNPIASQQHVPFSKPCHCTCIRLLRWHFFSFT